VCETSKQKKEKKVRREGGRYLQSLKSSRGEGRPLRRSKKQAIGGGTVYRTASTGVRPQKPWMGPGGGGRKKTLKEGT